MIKAPFTSKNTFEKPNEQMVDESTQLIILLKYMITLKNIKNLKLRIKDLNIELENLQNDLDAIRETLTTCIINGQKISLDDSNNINISSTND